MDRQKYINDISYREGYDDGKKEGASSTLAITIGFLNKLSNDIEYMKKIMSDAINNEGTIVEANKEIRNDTESCADIWGTRALKCRKWGWSMIHIVGDTFEELADLQTLLETGRLNLRNGIMVDVTYELWRNRKNQ